VHIKSTRVSHYRYCRIIRLSPRDGSTAYSMFSPETGFVVSVAGGDTESIVANLTPASGRQDRMALPYAARVVRLATLPRPSHPAPNVRDDRETPLMWARDARRNASDLPVVASERACDQLARRANQVAIGNPCQVRSNCLRILRQVRTAGWFASELKTARRHFSACAAVISGHRTEDSGALQADCFRRRLTE